MKESTRYQFGVTGVVKRARAFNPDIGAYVQHFETAEWKIVVRLSNGRLEMSAEIAQDQEKGSQFVTDERVNKVADTFTPL